MREKLTPAVLITPGQIIKRELREKRWTQKGLALVMNRPEQTISEIVNGKKRITPETARELAAAFGTSPEFWINLESNYQLHKAEKEKNEQEIRERSLLKAFQTDELKKRGWISGIVTLSSLKEFLGLDPVTEFASATARFRYSTLKEPKKEPLLSWYSRAKRLASLSKVNKTLSMEEGIKHLLDLANDQLAIDQIKHVLSEMGIVFLIIPKLKETALDGAVFKLDGKPVIVLTLRYDTIDCFWFNLMHELAHLYLGHEEIYFDDIEKNVKKDNNEDEADKLAAEWLIPTHEYKIFIKSLIPDRISEVQVVAFAHKIRRHPGIVIGRLQYDGKLSYGKLRKYRINISEFLSDFIDKPA